MATENYEHIEISNVPLGIHDLSLQLINKESSDTAIDAQGNIVYDLNAVIESLQVDGHEIKLQIDSVALYKNDLGQPVKTYGWLSYLQPMHLWIQAPGWYFVRNLGACADESVYSYFQSQHKTQKPVNCTVSVKRHNYTA